MSEEVKAADESPKKRKGKLPILIALVVIFAGGGFFGMKMRGGSAAKPEIKLGAIEPLQEFLVNLAGTSSYIKVEIALHLREGFKKEELDKNLPAVRDAVVMRLSSRSLKDVNSFAGKERLKRELALDINSVLESLSAKPEHQSEEKDAKKDKNPEEKKEAASKPKNPDWVSEEGPVLKIYFTSFATQ